MKSFKRIKLSLFAIAAIAVTAVNLSSCQSTFPSRNPVGETFPKLIGESLEEKPVSLPLPEKTVLLIGYVQEAQFDADRWLYGLLQAQLGIRIIELPTIRGFLPRLVSGQIDSGMRSGIPQEDWASVVTVYGPDATKIQKLTGNQKTRNMRVLLLDENGKILWFHDRGFSAGKLIELERLVR